MLSCSASEAVVMATNRPDESCRAANEFLRISVFSLRPSVVFRGQLLMGWWCDLSCWLRLIKLFRNLGHSTIAEWACFSAGTLATMCWKLLAWHQDCLQCLHKIADLSWIGCRIVGSGDAAIFHRHCYQWQWLSFTVLVIINIICDFGNFFGSSQR